MRVTFKTDADTSIFRDRKAAALADLLPGDELKVVIVTEDEATDQEALGEPAFLVAAKAPKIKPAFFGFAGEVKSVDGADITLSVKRATKSARKLLPSNQDVTFTTDADTRIVVGKAKGTLADLSAGDQAAVGIRAPKGSTLEQVTATPAKIVIGFTKGKADAARLRRMAARAASLAKAARH